MRTEKRRLDPNCKLSKLRRHRHREGRDLKVVITQRNSGTGGGKTTLAGWLCLNWDDNWNAKQQAMLDPDDFIASYPELPPHSCLLLDEAEELDARRSMAEQNVEFAKQWMMMRTRQIDSILTLPTASALDKRIKELADVRINVIERGLANVYKIRIDDHNTSQVRERFLHEIEWPDISERDEMQELEAMKNERINGKVEEAKEDSSPDPEDVERKVEKKHAQRLRNNGMTMRDIGDVIGYSASWVSEHTSEAATDGGQQE
jgi:Zonular occludens toxin (Zot).